MKKIAVMTWYKENYGSTLQAYALCETLKKEDHDVEIINYDPKYYKKNIFEYNIKYIYNQVFNKIAIYKNKNIFSNIKEEYSKFITKNMNISRKCIGHTDLKNMIENKDAIICGSDQIWSPLTFDSNFFLDFVDDKTTIAYGPSIGVSKIENIELKNRIEELISKIDYVSFRENQAKKILGFNKAKVVVDPTLLMSKEEWIKKLDLKKNNKKYILCYFLANNPRYVKYAKKLSKVLNMDILYIPKNNISLGKNKEIINNCGPKQFVESIYNASFVLTDSYHGLLFSLIFNKEFFVVERFKNKNKESQNSRIYNIIDFLDIKNRILKKYKDIDNCNIKIEYGKISKKLESKITESKDFLQNSIINSKKKEQINITKKCTGCGMCTLVCPKRCIEIVKNQNGFLEYKINKEKCISCGLCKSVCAQCYNETEELKDKKLYAGKSNTTETIISSTSGGIAYELTKLAITEKMKVIGCFYDKNKNVAEHIIVDNDKDLHKLKGSKYLQSFTTNAFSKILEIDKGLIIGTPCQIASINNYLQKHNRRNDFILVDLICHGVPSYLLWEKTIKNYSYIEYVNFRDKSKGWHKILLNINNKIINNKFFFNFFNYNLIYNECCYDCNYRQKSAADIRLGDFWGNKYKKENYGMNMIITLTKKGEEFLLKANNIYIKQEDISDYYQIQQVKNIILPRDYFNIIKDLKDPNITWNDMYKKYCKKIVWDQKIRKIGFKLISRIYKR